MCKRIKENKLDTYKSKNSNKILSIDISNTYDKI